MNIKSYISEILWEITTHQFGATEHHVSHSDIEGIDYQFNGAFKIAKHVGKSPTEVAEQIIAHFPQDTITASLGGKGFVNFVVKNEMLSHRMSILQDDSSFGIECPARERNIVLDFGGPNVAKPLHVGHLRSAIIGDTLAHIFRFSGHQVVTDCHLGDWGLQMGLLIAAIEDKFPELPYFDMSFRGEYPDTAPVSLDELETMYPIASKKAETDEAFKARAQLATKILQRPVTFCDEGIMIPNGYKELWRKIVAVSVSQIKIDFEKLDVNFNLWRGESHTADGIPYMIDGLKQMNLVVEDDGALIMPLEEEGLPPLIITSQVGSALYGTTDLATIRERLVYNPTDIMYCVDYRQSSHFEQVFAAARKSGFNDGANLEHLKNGTVNGADGKPFKTRSGGTAKLIDLIDMAEDAAREALKTSKSVYDLSEVEINRTIKDIALAALRFGELINKRTDSYVFDTSKFGFEGKTGPYIIYQGVRIRSALKKAKENGGPIIIGEAERELAILIDEMSTAYDLAYEEKMPHHLAAHVYKLANAFSRYYSQVDILSEKDDTIRKSRLSLLELVYSVLELELNLMGIRIPVAM